MWDVKQPAFARFSISPVLFLRLLSLEYILVKGEDEEERMSAEASAAFKDDDEDNEDDAAVRVVSDSVR